eukprot:TRINITY_DN64180_c0_g1_i1.p3 TRINITY_DN64180_c0_g1~~TRINITY_DN64180_c0_g1_i1.p3  ORF type:complete len:115 (-),score=56.98 TRINITY_DN64180_c0_g1_i1:345-656(-)
MLRSLVGSEMCIRDRAALQRRLFEEAGRKANKLGIELKQERGQLQKVEGRLEKVHEQVEAAERECALLRQQNAELTSGSDHLRRQVSGLKEAARTSKLHMRKN